MEVVAVAFVVLVAHEAVVVPGHENVVLVVQELPGDLFGVLV